MERGRSLRFGPGIIVATDPFTAAWLAGFAANAAGGPSPFSATAVAIVSDGGTPLRSATAIVASIDNA
jgi:hypothetical protein